MEIPPQVGERSNSALGRPFLAALRKRKSLKPNPLQASQLLLQKPSTPTDSSNGMGMWERLVQLDMQDFSAQTPADSSSSGGKSVEPAEAAGSLSNRTKPPLSSSPSLLLSPKMSRDSTAASLSPRSNRMEEIFTTNLSKRETESTFPVTYVRPVTPTLVLPTEDTAAREDVVMSLEAETLLPPHIAVPISASLTPKAEIDTSSFLSGATTACRNSHVDTCGAVSPLLLLPLETIRQIMLPAFAQSILSRDPQQNAETIAKISREVTDEQVMRVAEMLPKIVDAAARVRQQVADGVIVGEIAEKLYAWRTTADKMAAEKMAIAIVPTFYQATTPESSDSSTNSDRVTRDQQDEVDGMDLTDDSQQQFSRSGSAQSIPPQDHFTPANAMTPSQAKASHQVLEMPLMALPPVRHRSLDESPFALEQSYGSSSASPSMFLRNTEHFITASSNSPIPQPAWNPLVTDPQEPAPRQLDNPTSIGKSASMSPRSDRRRTNPSPQQPQPSPTASRHSLQSSDARVARVRGGTPTSDQEFYYRCPNPDCIKSYKLRASLKRHREQGWCKTAKVPLSPAKLAANRAFPCRVGDCKASFATVVALRAHYHRSKKPAGHGEEGLRLLITGKHPSYLGKVIRLHKYRQKEPTRKRKKIEKPHADEDEVDELHDDDDDDFDSDLDDADDTPLMLKVQQGTQTMTSKSADGTPRERSSDTEETSEEEDEPLLFALRPVDASNLPSAVSDVQEPANVIKETVTKPGVILSQALSSEYVFAKTISFTLDESLVESTRGWSVGTAITDFNGPICRFQVNCFRGAELSHETSWPPSASPLFVRLNGGKHLQCNPVPVMFKTQRHEPLDVSSDMKPGLNEIEICHAGALAEWTMTLECVPASTQHIKALESSQLEEETWKDLLEGFSNSSLFGEGLKS